MRLCVFVAVVGLLLAPGRAARAACPPGDTVTATWVDAYGQTTYALTAPCVVYVGTPFDVTARVTDAWYPDSLVGSSWAIKDNGVIIAGGGFNWIEVVGGAWQRVVTLTYAGAPIPHTLQFTFKDLGQGAGAHSWSGSVTVPVAVTAALPGQAPPVANAGPDRTVPTAAYAASTVVGHATDLNGDALTYRWLEGMTEIQGPQPVGPTGDAPLSLGGITPRLGLGTHALTLEVGDGQAVTTDSMVLTIVSSLDPATCAFAAPAFACGGASSNLLAADGSFPPEFYSWSATVGSLSAASGPAVTWTAPTSPSAPGADLGLVITDDWGASVSCQATVALDTTAPVVTAPGDSSVCNDPATCAAIVTFAASATDACPVSVVAAPASGGAFPVGTTVVTLTATDGAGNVTTATFDVTVGDCQPPTIAPPPDVARCNDAGLCRAVVGALGTPTVADNCSATAALVPPPPPSFPVGTTALTWVATDGAGNTASATQHVRVSDCEPPAIGCPAPLHACVVAPVGTVQPVPPGFAATATDNCGVTSLTPPPATQAAGCTPVPLTFVARDAANHQASCGTTLELESQAAVTVNAPQGVLTGDPLAVTGSVVGGCTPALAWSIAGPSTPAFSGQGTAQILLASGFTTAGAYTETLTATNPGGTCPANDSAPTMALPLGATAYVETGCTLVQDGMTVAFHNNGALNSITPNNPNFDLQLTNRGDLTRFVVTIDLPRFPPLAPLSLNTTDYPPLVGTPAFELRGGNAVSIRDGASCNAGTSVRATASITYTTVGGLVTQVHVDAPVPATGTMWISLALRSRLTNTHGWALGPPPAGTPNSRTLFDQDYLFETTLAGTSSSLGAFVVDQPLAMATNASANLVTGIGGYALDVNGNPVADTVTLTNGAVVTTTTTDPGTGAYLFRGLAPGTYTVSVPANRVVVPGTSPRTLTLIANDYREIDFFDLSP
jgi:hypothetical protein